MADPELIGCGGIVIHERERVSRSIPGLADAICSAERHRGSDLRLCENQRSGERVVFEIFESSKQCGDL